MGCKGNHQCVSDSFKVMLEGDVLLGVEILLGLPSNNGSIEVVHYNHNKYNIHLI